MFEIGASLRDARLKRNLSPADVHEAIRIRARYLQALEDERWELLPGEAYAKGFLREYADFLGLDGNLYVDEFNSRFANREEQPLAPPPVLKSPSRIGGVGLLRPVLAIVAILAIVAAVAAWQLHRSSKSGATQPPATTTTQSTTPTKKHHTPPPVALPTHAVLVASRGATWLEVRYGSQAGKLVYESTLQKGQKLTVPLTRGAVWIRVGLPANLDVRLGGKLAHGLPSQVGNVLLTQHGLRPA